MNFIRYVALAIVLTSLKSAHGLDESENEKMKWRSKNITRNLINTSRDFKHLLSVKEIIIYNKEDNKNSEIMQISSKGELEEPIVPSLLSRVRRGDPEKQKSKGSKNKANCKSGEKKCGRRKGRKKRVRTKKKKGGRRKSKGRKRKGKKRKGKKTHKKAQNHIEIFANQTLIPAMLKDIDEECVRSAECKPGLCCARHKWKRWCRPLLKVDQTCMGPDPKHRKRSPDELHELCPCEDGLMCQKVGRSRKSKCTNVANT